MIESSLYENPFEWRYEFPEVLDENGAFIGFDLIVGNPPFGTKKLSPTITAYCKKENFAQEMVLPFLYKATLLAPKGKIALIFNTKVLTNTGGTYQNFRRWLFNRQFGP